MSSQNEESNHEFNFFLDKQIQTKILDFTENEKLEVEIQSAVKVSKKLDYDFELCEWIPKKGFTPRKPEKDTKDNLEVKVHFSHRDRDGLLPNSLKPKQYNFKHYTDVSQYMLQYRLENSSTQNQSNRTKSGKQKKQILKSRQSSRQKEDSLTQLQNNSTDIKVVATLAYKYKLDPRVPNWPSSPESTVDIYSIEDGERKSARVPSARDTISARASGTVNLTPTKGRSNTSSISSPTIGSAISTKSMHVTPQGMYNLDDRNGLPSSFITDLGTHEMTSSVTSNGRQMWFDAGGRAYVSLTTRYQQPYRK
ncbi:unnamed protein product [Owenia fusiformis]|uniref:Uncharacterized protein n=1 Tax=Owenia fusiformis TaxID=6347 RepID=A0A8S4P4Y4_OWEFU|nr:unnamed protein product [Owenia fusiformis]